jgi:hypothetical protein
MDTDRLCLAAAVRVRECRALVDVISSAEWVIGQPPPSAGECVCACVDATHGTNMRCDRKKKTPTHAMLPRQLLLPFLQPCPW